MSATTQKTLGALFPHLAAELAGLIAVSEHPELAAQVPDLPVVARCTCAQSNCATFYTAPPPSPSYPPGHFNVMLAAATGLVVLDVVDARIVAVELLDRADVKPLLDAYMPVLPSHAG